MRRLRGTPTVALNVLVLPEVKDRIDAVCNRYDLPLLAVVEAAVMAAEPDPTIGIPTGWELPLNEETSLPGMNGGGVAVRNRP